RLEHGAEHGRIGREAVAQRLGHGADLEDGESHGLWVRNWIREPECGANDRRVQSGQAGMNSSEMPLRQWRLPVGGGPSSKIWPRCPPQRLQWHSVRTMKSDVSSDVPMAPGSGSQKLGHPVPLSYLVSDE